MRHFADRSTVFLHLLPWAVHGVNDGKGPFEKDNFVAPDYTSSYFLDLWPFVLATLSKLQMSQIYVKTCGFKNIIVANRMNANDSPHVCIITFPTRKLKISGNALTSFDSLRQPYTNYSGMGAASY
ncbi:hypothetical protein GGS24DRAFT_514188 [Hypoxylon argillaceum]|nr:hypothetical protein GGS24DRAFT_514188 [Hypoxylon argillaceum]